MVLKLDPEDHAFYRGMAVNRRAVSDEQMRKFESYMAEIFTAFGMDMTLPSTERTPERYIKALLDVTEGYEGDPKLITAFDTECRGEPACLTDQIVEGPISFFALCEHHALPFHACIRWLHSMQKNYRHFQAHSPGACVCLSIHGAGKNRQTNNRYACRKA